MPELSVRVNKGQKDNWKIQTKYGSETCLDGRFEDGRTSVFKTELEVAQLNTPMFFTRKYQ